MKILKVAEKYEVKTVKPVIAQQLRADWPTTLAEWLRLEADIDEAVTMDATRLNEFSGERFIDLFPEPAAAIRLALEHNIPEILPAALYTLARVNFKDDFDKWQLDEWKYWNDLSDDGENPTWDCLRTARWSQLDKEGLYCLLLGREELEEREEGLRLHVLTKSSGCTSGDVCSSERKRMNKIRKRGAASRPDPLSVLRGWLNTLSDYEFCSLCSISLEEDIKTKMIKTWDDLPKIFRIDVLLGSE